MKKLLTVLLSVLMLVSLAACGSNTEEETVEFNGATAAIYSMDLSDIEGYEDYVVENGTWAETYDVLIALCKTEMDADKRNALYHKAEDLLMSTGDIVPLYYYTDPYMISKDVEGYFGTSLGMKYFMYTTVGGSGDNINISIASEPDTIDPAANSSVDGGIIVLHMFSGLVGYNANGELVANCATELPTPTIAEDGKATYVFQLKDGMTWSDGQPVKASDFEYAWKRASRDDFDYGYLFEIIDGYDGQGNLNVTADDDANTFTVVTVGELPYFFELCAFAPFMPVRQDVVGDDPTNTEWATDPATYVTNGAYTISEWVHDNKIVFTKSETYWDAANVTMNQITDYLSDDDVTILSWFKNGQCDFIDSVPNDEIDTLKADYPDEFVVGPQNGTYYVIFNNDENLLPDDVIADMTNDEIALANEEVRQAISLLLDRNYIVNEIGKCGQQPASSFVAKGITNTDGTQFYETAGDSADYVGYYDVSEEAFAGNCEKAMEILAKYYTIEDGKLTNFPAATYLYNNGSGHQAIGEYIQSALAAYGINFSLDNQEWATFLQTRKEGNFTVARNGWLADYNDAITYLDMWTTVSGNNDAQLGK